MTARAKPEPGEGECGHEISLIPSNEINALRDSRRDSATISSPSRKARRRIAAVNGDPAMAGVLQDRGTFQGIARTLLALAQLAECAAGRSFPVRFLVLAILSRAEAIARAFVARTSATLIAEAIEAGCPDFPFPDLACLDEPTGLHCGPADAALLALRLRMLAAVLGALADTDGDSDDRSAGWFASLPPYPGAAPLLPLLLVVRLPAALRQPRSHDTS